MDDTNRYRAFMTAETGRSGSETSPGGDAHVWLTCTAGAI